MGRDQRQKCNGIAQKSLLHPQLTPVRKRAEDSSSSTSKTKPRPQGTVAHEALCVSQVLKTSCTDYPSTVTRMTWSREYCG